MKRNERMLALIALAAGAVLPALAQDKPALDPASHYERHESQEVRRMSGLGPVEKATKIRGMEIRDAEDHKLGHVKDLAVDLERGRVVEVLVSYGGVLGVGSKVIAVPPGALNPDYTNKILRLNVDRNKFKDAPAFDMTKWHTSFDRERVETVYSYYGAEPYFVRENRSPSGVGTLRTEPDRDTIRTTARERDALRTDIADRDALRADRGGPGYVERESKIVGLAIKNNQGESLGSVENLLVDLRSGHIVAVVVASGGFLGIGDELSMAPPAAFQFNPDHDNLRLDATKETLVNAPHFKSSEWPDSSDTTYYNSVYNAYHARPYYNADAVAGTELSRRHEVNAPNPLNQSNAKEDLERTRAIRKEIVSEKNLSLDAHNVKITTVNGRLTLRGTVNSDEEKQRIGEIANKIEDGRNTVDNQLEVNKSAINR